MLSLVIYKMKNMGTSARNRINFGRVRKEFSAIQAASEEDYLPPGVGKMMKRTMLRGGRNLSEIRGKQASLTPRLGDARC